MAVMICLNCIHVAFDDAIRSSENESNVTWILVEGLFRLVFLADFFIKFMIMRLSCFRDGSSVFDFVLIILFFLGLVMELVTRSAVQDNNNSSEARIVRVVRVFRVLRLLWVFRLFFAKFSSTNDVSVDTANRMRKITIINSFTHAHLVSQVLLAKYLGGNGVTDEVDEAMIARCILQSQVYVHAAIARVAKEERLINKTFVDEATWDMGGPT